MIRTAQVKVIIGLGNPGREYERTYHNAGVLSLPFIAANLASGAVPLDFKRYKDSFEYASAGNVTLVKPLTYMNESGAAVRDALKVLRVSPEDIAVAHDDSDLTIGDFRIVKGGGAAGHKGILSIVAHIGTEDFLRIRIGIRAANEARRKKAGDFVLSTITPSDMKMLESAFGEISKNLGIEK